MHAAATTDVPPSPAAPRPGHVRVAIVGSGFGGLCAAIRLKQQGRDDFVVFERESTLGGTWRDNRYPGAACDVPSHLYSYSFAPNPQWTRWYSCQQEIREYLERCADRFDVRGHVRFGHDVQRLAWDEAAGRWRITTPRGEWTAKFVVAAPGPLAEPRIPLLPGFERYEGRAFHTARWPDALAVAGGRVAVIGTGASVVQIVPAIQPHVARLTIFQRTPPWVVPRNDFELPASLRARFERWPAFAKLVRASLYTGHEIAGLPFRHMWAARIGQQIARLHLRRQVRNPALRRRLTPAYTIGCKRVLLSDDWYPALQRPNVDLVDEAATSFTRRGVVGADGVEREADVVVFGTGFDVTGCPFADRVYGRDGRRLSDDWTPSPRAHLGTSVAGYPNLFFLLGPNTALGHSSVVLIIEAQVAHVLNALRAADEAGVGIVEPRAQAQADYVADVDRRMRTTVWLAGGCRSWYLDSTGRAAATWPRSVGAFRRRVEPFRADEYLLRTAQRERAAEHV